MSFLPRPLRPIRLVRRLLSRSRVTLVVVALGLVLMGLAWAWNYTALSEFAEPRRIGEFLAASKGEPWAFVVVVAVFVLGGVMVFPLNIMILAAAATFGPWFGILYSALGALCSAALMHTVGARLGKEALARLLGQRWERALEGIRSRGLLTVVTLRVMPVAPFTLVNLAAGASGIRFADLMLGSLIGLMPGLLLMSFIGDRIVRVVTNPGGVEVALLILGVVAYVGLAFAAQALLSRRRSKTS